MTIKSTFFGARRTNVTGLNAREPCTEELALSKSVESGNPGLNKAVIRWKEQLCLVPMYRRSPQHLPLPRAKEGQV